jgi:hypothetical protein
MIKRLLVKKTDKKQKCSHLIIGLVLITESIYEIFFIFIIEIIQLDSLSEVKSFFIITSISWDILYTYSMTEIFTWLIFVQHMAEMYDTLIN